MAALLAIPVGTMMVMPTAGETPILLGYPWRSRRLGVRALLPAISLSLKAMVARVMSVKVAVVMAVAVAAQGGCLCCSSLGFASVRPGLVIPPWVARKCDPGVKLLGLR